jgi:hypothetical protein
MGQKGDCTFLGILGRHGEVFVVLVVLALEKSRQNEILRIQNRVCDLCAGGPCYHVTARFQVLPRLALGIFHFPRQQNSNAFSTLQYGQQ